MRSEKFNCENLDFFDIGMEIYVDDGTVCYLNCVFIVEIILTGIIRASLFVNHNLQE